MDDLIESLQILKKYGNSLWPTGCEHDVLIIMDIDPCRVSEKDKLRLDELGFFVSAEFGDPCFISYRYGSA